MKLAGGLSVLFLAVFLIAGCGGGGGGENHPPTVDLRADPTTWGDSPLTVIFTADASDADGDPLTYSWVFETGEPVEGNATEEHVYTTPGIYTATVTVSDGTDSVSDTLTIEAEDPGNLVDNAGFERDSDWFFLGENPAARVSDNARTGAHCLMYSAGEGFCAQTITGGFVPGDTIKISGWIKSADTSAQQANIDLEFLDESGSKIGAAAQAIMSDPAAEYSQVLKENVEVPAGTTSIRVLILGFSTPDGAVIYVDDVYVGVVGL